MFSFQLSTLRCKNLTGLHVTVRPKDLKAIKKPPSSGPAIYEGGVGGIRKLAIAMEILRALPTALLELRFLSLLSRIIGSTGMIENLPISSSQDLLKREPPN